MITSTIDSQPASNLHKNAAGSPWRSLYRIGAVAALIQVATVPIAIVFYILWPPPGYQPTQSIVLNWFILFQRHPFQGLVDLDLFMMLGEALGILMTLALYVALRHASPSYMAISLALCLVGTAVYFPSNPAFSFLTLSNQYAAATTDAQRSSLVGAGQATLAAYQGTAFNVSYVMLGISLLLIAVVMLRSPLFYKGIAYVGIATGALMLIPPTIGPVGFVFSFGSLVPLIIWDIWIARRLFILEQSCAATGSPA